MIMRVKSKPPQVEKMEKDFVLDCNTLKAKIPKYDGIQDKNLRYYYQNPNIRAVLFKNGVVTSN
jgi:hypothetical protein